MRKVHDLRRTLDVPDITKIRFDPKSRDDIPALLMELQEPYCDRDVRERSFELPDRKVLPGRSRRVGRPGMDPWQILVPGVVKQGLGCDFDRLHELTARHVTLRAMPGHGRRDDGECTHRRLVDNVSLPTPDLLQEVGSRSWRPAIGWPEKGLAPRCAAAVTPSRWRPTGISRWMRCAACSGRCSGPAGGSGSGAGAGAGTDGRGFAGRISGSAPRSVPMPVRRR